MGKLFTGSLIIGLEVTAAVLDWSAQKLRATATDFNRYLARMERLG